GGPGRARRTVAGDGLVARWWCAARRRGLGRPRPQTAPPPIPFNVNTNTAGVDYEPGQIVQHEQYGIGTVSDVSGYGALRKIKIRFAVGGEKTFIADKVKLKVVTKK